MPWYDRVALRVDALLSSIFELVEHPLATVARHAGSVSWVWRRAGAVVFGVALSSYALFHATRAGEILEGSSWGRFFAIQLACGLVFGPLLLALGRWWFEVRLFLLGVSPIPAGVAYDVHLLPGLIWTVPTAAGPLLLSLVYATPADLVGSPGSWAALPALGLVGLWSGLVFLLSVRRVFRLDTPRLILGFLLLPVLTMGGLRFLLGLLKAGAR